MNQVQQAQGAALSVTQTALAVVGGIIGSSLLTVAAFVLVLRYRRNKRRRSRQLRSRDAAAVANISYPELKGASSNATGGGYASSDAESNYSTDDNGYRVDVKEPQPVAARGSVAPGGATGRSSPRVGYALSYYAPGPQQQFASRKNSNSKSNNGRMNGTTAGGGGFQLSDPPRGKFSLFPKGTAGSREDLNMNQGPGSGLSAAMTPSSSGGSPVSGRGGSPQRASKGVIPSLDTWLRAGTVSPFATLKKDASAAGK